MLVWAANVPVVGWLPVPANFCTDGGADIVDLSLTTQAEVAVIVVTYAAPRGLECGGSTAVALTWSSYDERIALWGHEPSLTVKRVEWRDSPETCITLHWSDFDDASWCSPADFDELHWSADVPLVGTVVTGSGRERAFDMRGQVSLFADVWVSHSFDAGPARTYVGITDMVPPLTVSL